MAHILIDRALLDPFGSCQTNLQHCLRQRYMPWTRNVQAQHLSQQRSGNRLNSASFTARQTLTSPQFRGLNEKRKSVLDTAPRATAGFPGGEKPPSLSSVKVDPTDYSCRDLEPDIVQQSVFDLFPAVPSVHQFDPVNLPTQRA